MATNTSADTASQNWECCLQFFPAQGGSLKSFGGAGLSTRRQSTSGHWLHPRGLTPHEVLRSHQGSPNSEPRKLEPAKVGCAELAVLNATGHLGRRRVNDRLPPRTSSKCRLPDRTLPVPASRRAASTPGEQPHGGYSPQWPPGCQSLGISAACKASPCYPPGRPWKQSRSRKVTPFQT